MGNLEKQLDTQGAFIRDYLLGRLNETKAQEIDEKIIAEPDFYDCILLIEQELLEDLVAGRLSGEDKVLTEQIYRSPVNREKLDFAATLYKVAEEHHQQEIVALSNQAVESPVKPSPRKTFLDFWNWRTLTFAGAVLIVVIGSSFFVWQLVSGGRTALESELARLNQSEVNQISGKNLREITLQADSFRSVSLMPKIQISGSEDEIIRFQLGVINGTSETYEAIFFDDQGNEMFSIADLKPQRKQDGTYIHILVPSKVLRSGDYQINLQGRSANNDLAKVGSYTFRLAEQ